MDFGIFVEGFVELEPLTGRMVLRVPQGDGSNIFIDIQEQLGKYKGEEVRFILTPLSTVADLAKMVESGEISLEGVSAIKTPGNS
jgi:hypothetical protein